MAVYEILRAGGFSSGGFNFDTKLRRQSMDRSDLFHGHIGGIDTLARSLLIAENLLAAGDLEQARASRYAGWDTPSGQRILSGGVDLATLADESVGTNLDPKAVSGRQEMLENVINRAIWTTRS